MPPLGRWARNLSALRVTSLEFLDEEGRSVPVQLALGSSRPLAVRLYPNTPNPFNGQTLIRYDLPARTRSTLSLHNLTGQVVRVLVDWEQAAGSYAEVWDGRDQEGRAVSSGVYLYRLRAGDQMQVRRMLLVQ